MMFCLGNSFATVLTCVACVLISMIPIKTAHRPERQLTRGISAEGRGETSASGQNNTEITGKETSGSSHGRAGSSGKPIGTARKELSNGKDTVRSSGNRVNVRAMKMSALWSNKSDGYTVIPYFLAGQPSPSTRDLDIVFNYISGEVCVRFERLPSRTDCYGAVTRPTVCVTADRDSEACFSDSTGVDAEAAADGEPQLLHVPSLGCPFHEGVQSVAKLLGLLPEHRRADRDGTLKVLVTASGTDRLLFAQALTAACADYEDDSPLDLYSVSGLDTSASILRHGSMDGMRSLEHGMVVAVRNIRCVLSLYGSSVCSLAKF